LSLLVPNFRSRSMLIPTVDAIFAGLLVTAVAFTTTLVLRHEAIDAYKRRFDESMQDVARITAMSLNHTIIEHPPETDTAVQIDASLMSPIRKIRESVPSVRQASVLKYEGGKFLFLASTATSPAGASSLMDPLTPYHDASSEAIRAAEQGSTAYSREVYSGRYGDVISIWEPLFGDSGKVIGVVGLDINAERYRSAMSQIKDAVDRGFAIACVAGLGAFIGVYFLRRKALLADAVIRDSETRFRELADAAPVMLWTADSLGRRTFFSQPWSEFTGRDGSELVAGGWLEAIHEDDQDLTARTCAAAIAERRVFETEYRLRQRSGEYRWVTDRGVPRESATGAFLGYVGGCMDVTERKGAEQALEHAAMFDRLTGMPNRVLLLDRLQQAVLRYRRRTGKTFAVIFLDFDRFKFINDTLGHESGDELLRQIAQRLRSTLRVSDSISRDARGHTAARFGGDEFVVLLEDLERSDDALVIADRLLAALAEPFELAGRKIASTASMGIVMAGDGYTSPHDLLRDADTAMYEAKAAGKGRYIVFDTTMRQRVERRVRVEQDLAGAIKQGDFVLHYQPVVDLESGEMISIEALVRWHHPTFGLVSPAEFIQVAEETGLIDALGDWVFNEACSQFRRWADTGIADRIGSVAVNLSRKQLPKPDLAEKLIAAAARHGVSPGAICLEITETAIMADVQASLTQLRALKAAGFKLSLDDFGSGHSSLSNVHEFPIDSIKIDRAFIANMLMGRAHTALIQAVVTLAHNLNMTVVAEGVERAEQVPLLQSLDCDSAQGWYFCGPVRAEEITARLMARSKAA
jgi:diguanylate cyclase (GGDEF)-like protein/PAS domain S-box-containing protein